MSSDAVGNPGIRVFSIIIVIFWGVGGGLGGWRHLSPLDLVCSPWKYILHGLNMALFVVCYTVVMTSNFH